MTRYQSIRDRRRTVAEIEADRRKADRIGAIFALVMLALVAALLWQSADARIEAAYAVEVTP